MAVEAKRGCGFRKVGGLYLVGSGNMVPCDRLNFPLEVCPCCNQGIKQSRGFTWIDFHAYAGVHTCTDGLGQEVPADVMFCRCRELAEKGERGRCPACDPMPGEKYGLLWIGKKFYPSPDDFVREALGQGISKRISQIPKGLEIGVTWIMLAHPEACAKEIDDPDIPDGKKTIKVPGIFYMFKPEAVEKIITETESKSAEEMAKLEKRGIRPVVVPDDDPDHKGTVYDKDKNEEDEHFDEVQRLKFGTGG